MVVVTDDGYLLDDRRFGSLSQVAQAITGAHWSGPRFFGIGCNTKKPGKQANRPTVTGEVARG